MVTAIVQSIVRQGLSLVANVQFSDRGLIQYSFSPGDTPTSITARIQSDIDSMNALDYQLTNIQSLVGTNFQTDPATLVTLKASVDTINSTAAQNVGNVQTAPVSTL